MIPIIIQAHDSLENTQITISLTATLYYRE